MIRSAYWKRLALGLIGTVLLLTTVGCAGGPLTTREQAAGIGAVGGAAVGGLVGAAVGHPAGGALIGGGLGLTAGALIGDHIQGQQGSQSQQGQQRIDQNQAEINRQRREADRLKQGEY